MAAAYATTSTQQYSLLSDEDQQVLKAHHERKNQLLPTLSSARTRPTLDVLDHMDFNDCPNFSLDQTQSFSQGEWNRRIFRPFLILTQRQSLGIALRFLAYVPLVPNHVTIPHEVKELCREIGIGDTLIQITIFFMRDLPHLHDTFPPLRENDLRHNTIALNIYDEKRSAYHQLLMRSLRQ